MKHKVAELEGSLLDAAVALANGWKWSEVREPNPHVDGWGRDLPGTAAPGSYVTDHQWVDQEGRKHGNKLAYDPSRDWRKGGPIIERERIAVLHVGGHEGFWQAGYEPQCDEGWRCDSGWMELPAIKLKHESSGTTLLIAAMRAYVCAKLGEEVELP